MYMYSNFVYIFKEQNMFSVSSQPGENWGKCLEEFESRPVKTQDAVEGFYLLEISHKLCRGFQQAIYEGTDNMFYFFHKIIIFCLTKEKAHMCTLSSFMKV